ncbi:hypothetical protein [Flavobacterium sp. DG2-3]|uniref:hypothetical protein n=1 Tax=Flavobacterium sp. DG2-3 TaxID=3068317 RepID=UPI00273FC002|nr:hypothetical protein [Flavobacterium sp. DG2-3]MDP5199312.1 hypothetical protein [Flavobacterium sp. DG2-3]
METNYKITIPEPCQENWDKMTPKDNGRFCMSCSKTVIDFTSMFPEEIQHYFIQNQNEKICGRFKQSQLDSITIQIPNRVLYSQTNYSKMFLLALFVAMGTTLFSCADKNGNKNKIDKIEIVEDEKQDGNSKQIPPPPAPPLKQNSDHNKKTIKRTTGEIVLENQTKSNHTTQKDCTEITYEENQSLAEKKIANDSILKNNEIVYMGAAIVKNADYPNGINAFYEFFAEEFKIPEEVENTTDRIIVSFVIGKDGSLTAFQFPKDIDPQLESEITRVLNLCPKWIPGEQNGKRTREKFSFPIVLEK